MGVGISSIDNLNEVPRRVRFTRGVQPQHFEERITTARYSTPPATLTRDYGQNLIVFQIVPLELGKASGGTANGPTQLSDLS